MNRLSKKNRERQIRINKSHFARKLAFFTQKKYGFRNKKLIRRHGHKKSEYIVVVAPSVIDLYKPKWHEQFITFKKSLEREAFSAHLSRRPIKICFRDTIAVTAAACLLLIATIDKIKNNFPSVAFKVSRPHSQPIKGIKTPINLVDAVFCQIGFYELIGFKTSSNHQNNPSVKCWKYASSEQSDGSIVGEVLKKITDMSISTSMLYRSCIEAISNAAEHAYSAEVVSTKVFKIKKWWIFVGNMNSEQIILICDIGHGIPNTLEVTQKRPLIVKIKELLGKDGDSKMDDWEYIQASTLVKETRTGMSHRGKGTTDLRTFVDKTDNSKMVIFSNKGVYKYYNKKSKVAYKAYDNKHSIGGTIIEWSVPVACC